MVKLLLDLKALVDIETTTGETALMAAVCNNKLDCVQHILNAKANVNFTSSASHQAAVCSAIRVMPHQSNNQDRLLLLPQSTN